MPPSLPPLLSVPNKLGEKENPNNSSSTTMEPEAIMICVDTSSWMEDTESPMFEEQAEAIKLYCNNKFKSHKQNVVGLCGMSEEYLYHLIYPTRKISEIIDAIYAVRIGGYLMVQEAVSHAYSVWFGSLDTDKQKRIAVFAGGDVYHTPPDMEILGQGMKKANLACDVINFGDRFMGKKKLFDTLIEYADNNGNCNICHVPPELSVREALSRSRIITPRVGGSGSAKSASLSLQHDRRIQICVKAATKSPDVPGDCPFCQRVLLTLAVKKLSYKTHFINLDNPPEWFVAVNPDGILPLIKFDDDDKWYSNSDDIVEMIDEKDPQTTLLSPPRFASVGFKILPKVLKFLKSQDEKYGIEEALLDELEELDKRLSQHGPYFNGGDITAADLSLAPKLYHLMVALGHFKQWTVPQTLVHVHKYTTLLFDCKSFKETEPSKDSIIAGWNLKLNPSSYAKL